MSTSEEASFVQFTPEQLHLAEGTPVGSGAISHVLRCQLTSPPIPVVVKVLSKVQLLQQKKVEAVMNEKAALLRLGPHPFIARLYGTAQSADELYFVMECLPHGDLLQHIRRTAAMRVEAYSAAMASAASGAATAPPPLVPISPSSRALRCLDFNDIQLITGQLVLALARAADRGVVLRDLKPENIVFDVKYRACLVDFDTADLQGRCQQPESNDGVALKPATTSSKAPAAGPRDAATQRLSVSAIQSTRKRTASFCGTAQYVSPEMVGECKWSFSSDLWALGATVYEMMYGTHMFTGANSFAVLRKVIHGCGGAADGPADASGSVVPFPEMDFAADEVAHAADAAGNAFSRVKAFVLGLMRIDPLRRLGVHPDTHDFDLRGLQSHPLFDGFNWEQLEAQERTFRPRVFARRTDHTTAGPAHSVADAVRGEQGARGDGSDSDPEPSPSLQALYHDLPFNDPSYAEYVYRATADANPFERYVQHILLGADAAGTGDGAQEAQHSYSTLSQASPPRPSLSSSNDSSSSSSCDHNKDDADADDTMDVIDDVGMHYAGMPAADDFHA